MKICTKCLATTEGICPKCGNDKAHEWIIHYVNDKICACCNPEHSHIYEAPTKINAHTHGLWQYNHFDFQIVLPLPLNTVGGILNDLSERVQKGEKMSPGMILANIIFNFDITFRKATEEGREVLRVILPDQEGNLAEDKIHADYKFQYEGTI